MFRCVTICCRFCQDAIAHVLRINRILESPRGNALLVGVGGSGKQSLSRLAAFISSLEVFQITLRKGYGIPDLKLDLATLYMKAGVKNIGTVLLMTDAQVLQTLNYLANYLCTTCTLCLKKPDGPDPCD